MSKTVLVVEDDKGVQKLLAEALEGEGFHVICEMDGSWALKSFEGKDIDFIVMDVLIPVMNGFQLADRIRKLPKGKNVPILMISGVYRSANYKAEALRKYGVIDYLDKPVKLEQIFTLIRNALGEERPGPAEDEHVTEKPKPDYQDAQGLQERREVEAFVEDPTTLEMSGNLKDIPFVDLLSRLYRRQATGALLLKHSKVKKIVYLREGRPVFVKSNLINECLGRIMVSEKMISQDDLEESVSRMQSSKRQQGTILIEMGAISPHNLVYALEKQLEMKLYDVFAWPEGDFQFSPKPSIDVPIITLELSTASIIYEGIKRRMPTAKIEAELASFANYLVTPNQDARLRFQDLLMDEDETTLLKSFEQTPRLRDLFSNPAIAGEKLLKFIYALKMTGMFQLAPASDAAAATPPPLPKTPPPLPVRPPSPPPLKTAAVAAPPPLPAAGIPADLKTLTDRILKMAAEVRDRNYFDLLGVARNAGVAEVNNAFAALAREFHPDKLPQGAGQEVKKAAQEIFKALGRAYEVLSDPRKRLTYENGLAAGKAGRPATGVSSILAAEGIFEQGRAYLEKRMFAKAAESFREAIAICDNEADFHAYLGWAQYQSDPGNPDTFQKAIGSLGRAISMNPKVEQSYLFLGYIYKSSGKADLAEQQFEKAIQCNPDSTEALRELKLLDIQRQGRYQGPV